MLKVAITGNIASGKSAVENILKSKGFPVLDTDEVSHEILKRSTIKTEIASSFNGFDIFEKSTDDSQKAEISRQKLGQIVFSNESLRRKLEDIIHPRVKEEIDKFFQIHKEKKVAFVSVPLLFETKMETLFDKVILIYAKDDIRLKRLMKRNNLPVEYAQNRIDIQMSQDKKISLADFVIHNNESIEHLTDSVDKIIELL